jgi:hypothetical protein
MKMTSPETTFLIVVIILGILYYTAHFNAMYAMFLAIALGVGFIIYTNSHVTKEDDQRRKRIMLNDDARSRYYQKINT